MSSFKSLLLAVVVIAMTMIPMSQAFKVQMNTATNKFSRTALSMRTNSPLSQLTLSKGVAAVLSAFVAISPVTAANYPEVIDPSSVVVNSETIDSEEFKSGLSGLKALQSSVKKLEERFAKNPQFNFADSLSTDFNLGSVRNTLNKYNVGFSEDSQRGSDRLIRLVLQDITLLERESGVKAGRERSANKIEAVQKRLEATETALNDLAAFYRGGK